MHPDIAARLFDVATGNFAQKEGATGVTGVTGVTGYASKSPALHRLHRLHLENASLGKRVSEGVTGAVTAPLETVQPASDALSASLPSAPVAASLEERRASVELLRDAMAEENERRRDWHKLPVEGWREGRVAILSALTGEAYVIPLPKRGRS